MPKDDRSQNGNYYYDDFDVDWISVDWNNNNGCSYYYNNNNKNNNNNKY